MCRLILTIVALINFSDGATVGRIVYPTLVESRDDLGQKVVRIDKDLTLTLRRSDFLRRELTTTYIQDGKWHHETVNSAIFGLYEDPDHLAAVQLHELHRGVQLRGLLTPSLYISPLITTQRSIDGEMAHEVRVLRNAYQYSPGARSAEVQLSERYIFQPQLPQTIWVDLVVVSDYEHRQLFASEEEHRTYVVLFMRMVTLRFNFHTPKIRFYLVQLYNANQQESSDILGVPNKGETTSEKTDFTIEGEEALDKLKEYMEKRPIIVDEGRPDIVYMLTKWPLTKEYSEDKSRYVIVPGVAYEGGVCTEYNTALGWDDGKFYLGADIAVRLMANMLGAPWETNETACTWKDGFVMGNYMAFGPNSYTFSNCSKEGIRKTLTERLEEDISFKRKNPLPDSEESDERGCFGRPFEYRVDILGNDLPGTTVDRNEFCRAVMPFDDKERIHICDDWFQNTKEWEEDECVTRCCYGRHWTLYQQIAYKPLDGFNCFHSKKVCYAGDCVDAGTNINSYG